MEKLSGLGGSWVVAATAIAAVVGIGGYMAFGPDGALRQAAPEPTVVAAVPASGRTEVVPQAAEGSDVVAALPAEPEPVPAAEPVTVAESPAAEDPVSDPPPLAAPTFDVVRVDADGNALIAGQAPAGFTVEVLVDGDVKAATPTDGGGAFVAIFDMDPSGTAQVVTLIARGLDGAMVRSEDNVILAPRRAQVAAAALARLADAPASTAPSAASDRADALAAPDAMAANAAVAAQMPEPTTAGPSTTAQGGGQVAGGRATSVQPSATAAPQGEASTAALVGTDATAPVEAPPRQAALTDQSNSVRQTEATAPRAEAPSPAAALVSEATQTTVPSSEASQVATASTVATEVAAASAVTTQSSSTALAETLAENPTARETARSAEAEAVGGVDDATVGRPLVTGTAVAGASDLTRVASAPGADAAQTVAAAQAAVPDGATEAQSVLATDTARAPATGVATASSVGALATPVPADQPTAPVPASAEPAAPAVAEAPAVLIAGRDGVRLLAPTRARPTTGDRIAIEVISYSETGEVLLEGRSRKQPPYAPRVRVYLNNRPLQTVEIAADGSWRTPLDKIDTGVYTLRVDQVADDGTVVSRFETPFKREDPGALARLAPIATEGVSAELITVQPGFTLWGIASETYGDGLRYVQLFEANKAQIKDPNLIYPGQVFELPEN